MKQVFQDLKTGETRLAEVPRPSAGTGQLLIRSHASLVSAGRWWARRAISSSSSMRLWRQDKGRQACVEAFVAAIGGNRPGAVPIPFEEVMEVSRVARSARRALDHGEPGWQGRRVGCVSAVAAHRQLDQIPR